MSEWKDTEMGLIPKDWIDTTVGDLVDQDIIEKPLDGNHGELHPKGSDFVEDGIPFIMATDINNGKVDLLNCKFITKNQADSLNKGFSITGDVLLTHKASLGRTAVVGAIPTPYIMLTPQVTYYRVKNKNKMSNIYLKYYFDSPFFQDTLLNHGDSGSTRAYVGITAQRDLPIYLPPLTEQKAIALMLSNLDDKIDLLHRQNKTLEAMAETLFRQWFVEEADEGWEEKPLNDLLEYVVDNRGKTVPTADFGISLIATNCIKNNNIFPVYEKVRYISEETYKDWFRAHPKSGDIIFVNKGTPGCINMVPNPVDFCIAQDMIALRVNKSVMSNYYLFLYLRSNEIQTQIMNFSVGTTIPHLKKTDLLKFPILHPNNKLLSDFDKIVDPFFIKMNNNQLQIRTLEKLRDTLLPKLMSGEVRVEV